MVPDMESRSRTGSPLPQVRPDEGADRNDAQMLAVGPVEREFDEGIAKVSAAEFLRYFRMNQLERLGRSLVHQERGMAVGGQLETAGYVIVNDCHATTLRVSLDPRGTRPRTGNRTFSVATTGKTAHPTAARALDGPEEECP